MLQGTTSVILPPDGDMSDYLDSLKYLQSLDLTFFAPGHGDVMDQPEKELKNLVAHRLRREQKVINCLTKLGPSGIDSLVLSVYDDVAQHLIHWAKRTLLAHLIMLEREGRVVSENDLYMLTQEE